MLTIDHFINGGTVDNAVMMRQWQLCQDAQNLTVWLEGLDCLPSIFKSQQADICHVMAWQRFNRRHNAMIDLIFAWNKASEIIEEQGERLRHAVTVAQRLYEASLHEYASLPEEELPF